MTKTYCDWCGAEISEVVGDGANVEIQPRYEPTEIKYEICGSCREALREFVMNRG